MIENKYNETVYAGQEKIRTKTNPLLHLLCMIGKLCLLVLSCTASQSLLDSIILYTQLPFTMAFSEDGAFLRIFFDI